MEVATAGDPAAAVGVASLQPFENNNDQVADRPEQQHSPAVEQENAYERERMERIKRNEDKMRQMGLRELAANTLGPAHPGSEADAAKKKKRARAAPAAAAAAPSGPRRQSARTNKDAPEHQAANHKENTAEESGAAAAALAVDDDELLVPMEEYFKNNENLSSAPRTNGTYRGWVAPRVIEKFGIAASEEAEAAAVAPAKRKKLGGGRTAARDFAATQLRTNPNAYFYRHVAPDQQQAQGEWTEEEHRQFMEVVRQHGVGDRWGMFASHIPQRVGYQCSAYYRDVVLPAGLVIDDRFKMTPSGKAVFKG